MDEKVIVQGLISAVLFGAIGIVLFAIAIKIIQKVVPFSLSKEIGEDQNVALGLVMAAILIGIALIVASAIHG